MILHLPDRNLQIINLGLVSMAAGLAGLALWNYASTAASPTATLAEIYPTSIPWLRDQVICEKTDRSWYDEQCWDDQHNPDF